MHYVERHVNGRTDGQTDRQTDRHELEQELNNCCDGRPWRIAKVEIPPLERSPSPIGVASYGALGHVPPSTYNYLFFSVHFDLYRV